MLKLRFDWYLMQRYFCKGYDYGKKQGLLPRSQEGVSNTLFFPCFYPAVRTGSSNTHFFTPPSGRGLVIPVFFLFLPRRQDGV